MFDTLEVVQPQQKQATPVRPATDRQVEVLVNLGLCATPDEARKARQYGYVFQAAGLYPWRTVSGNIKLPLEIMGYC